MDYYYRISAKEDKESITYTKSIVTAKQIEDLIRSNGYTPKIKKLTKMEIPMSEIEMVNDLNENRKMRKQIREGFLEYDDGYSEEEILDMLLEKADELGIDEDAIGYEVVEMVRNMMAEDGLSIDEAIDKAIDGICAADREYRSDYIWEVLYDMIPCAEDYGLPEPEFDDAEKVAQYIIDNGATVHGAMYAVMPAYREAVDREESGVNENTIKINEGTIRKIVAESVKTKLQELGASRWINFVDNTKQACDALDRALSFADNKALVVELTKARDIVSKVMWLINRQSGNK